MAKGDDAIAKKRNKAIRKKLRRDPHSKTIKSPAISTSDRVQRIIADKRRLKNQKRRRCRGMCYSLPTLENPFNDPFKYSPQKSGIKKKVSFESVVKEQLHSEKRNPLPRKKTIVEEKKNNLCEKKKKRKKSLMDDLEEGQLQKSVSQFDKVQNQAEDDNESKQNKDELSRRPSSFRQCIVTDGSNILQRNAIPEMVLELSLDAIRKIQLEDGIIEEGVEKLTTSHNWGIEFWKACLKGSNILGISKPSFDLGQTAWVVSAAASHVMNERKRDSRSCNPMVLYIVASQEHALKVRMAFKPLKRLLDIHSVSLHPGASVDRQIEGLRIYTPEIMVSTPDRLWELIASKSLDISSISFLVIDGLKNIVQGDFIEYLKSIKFHISGNPQTIVLSNTYDGMPTTLAQYLLKDPIQRVSIDSSIVLQSACITQAVYVFTSEGKKLQKVIKILRQINGETTTLVGNIVLVVNDAEKAQQVATSMECEGYFVNSVINELQVEEQIRGNVSENHRLKVLVTTESLLQEDVLSGSQVLIVYDFPSSFQSYSKLLTGMSRFSVRGVLYCFCSGPDASLAGQLIKLLDECSQSVPQTLRMLADAAASLLH